MKTTLSEQENALALRNVQQLRATFEEVWAIVKKIWSNLWLRLGFFRGAAAHLPFYIPFLAEKVYRPK